MFSFCLCSLNETSTKTKIETTGDDNTVHHRTCLNETSTKTKIETVKHLERENEAMV